MTIYFEDGELKPDFNLSFTYTKRIDAGKGFRNNLEELDNLMKSNPGATVYTNSLVALSNTYAWNETLKVPMIFVRSSPFSGFSRIDYLTEKEICRAHNILHMYMNGGFSQHEREVFEQ